MCERSLKLKFDCVRGENSHSERLGRKDKGKNDGASGMKSYIDLQSRPSLNGHSKREEEPMLELRFSVSTFLQRFRRLRSNKSFYTLTHQIFAGQVVHA